MRRTMLEHGESINAEEAKKRTVDRWSAQQTVAATCATQQHGTESYA
jgi:hypothetical protein